MSPNTYRPRALSLPIHQAPGFELSLANYNRTKSACAPIRSITDSPSLLITATPLNLHKRFLTGGFLQTAVSDAPPHDLPNLPAFLEWGASDTALAFLDNFRLADDSPRLST